MVGIDNTEAWKLIPPEEKIQLMSRAHSVGFLSALVSIIVFSTTAAALKISGIMWFGLLFAPFIFQFSSGKSWRALKPRIMLKYLGARSAARRFAFSDGARDLHIRLVLRGSLERLYERSDIQEALEAVATNNKESEVWIALFRDTLIMIKENPGGAVLAYGQPINDKFSIVSTDNGGYTNEKELTIDCKTRDGEERKYRVKSKFPGALAVLEKMTLQFQNEWKDSRVAIKAALDEVPTTEGEEDDSETLFAKF